MNSIYSFLYVFATMVVAIVFMLSFVGKIIDFKSFKVAIVRFGILPQKISENLAPVFLLLEGSVVTLVILGVKTAVFGYLIAIFLLLIFSSALLVVLRRSPHVSCNCFGISNQKISYYDLLRNILLVLSAGFGLIYSMQFNVGIYKVFTLEQTFIISLSALGCGLLLTQFADVIKTIYRPFTTPEI